MQWFSLNYAYDQKFPFFNQLNQMDCGPTCLKMISKYYEKNFSSPANKSF
ncbi:cysteine peptidase family C39 domain-containing protein [Pedobacter zeae]